MNAGAKLFESSAVTGFGRDTGGWRCQTPGGTIRAQRVVLAANGGNAALHPAMRGTTLPLHVFQFATAPLDAGQRQAILPEGGGYTDKQPYLCLLYTSRCV